MNDVRRTLLWVVFTMSLIMLWDGWNKHNGQPSMFSTPKPAATSGGAANPAPVPGSPAATAAGVPAATTVGGAGAIASLPNAPNGAVGAATGASEQVTLTTDVVKATFDTLGGSLVRLELLAHRDMVDATRNMVLFEQSPKRLYVAQSGLITGKAGVSLPNHQTPMKVAPGARTLTAGAKDISVRFESDPVDGKQLIKTYTLSQGAYTVAVKHELINDSAEMVPAQVYLQLARDGNAPEGESSFYFTFTGPAVYTDKQKFQKVEFKDIAKGSAGHEKTADNGWVAIVQHYFASAWLVPQAGPREFRTTKVADNHYTVALVMPMGEVAAGSRKSFESTLFAGPQEENKLAAIAPGLELVKDYGVLTVLSKPLFWLLTQLNQVLGNWGWAIVALVVLLKIAFYWLNASAYRSMAKMKAVTPKVTELRERFKDNPQQMQQETMRIYREEKVNPIGGCLPIFVQMPFFIALYWVLLSSVEMRNAPWIGWITDLAAKDPWYILPVLMTASSLFQVWLNPTPADPMQAKMMWFMPLAFGIMFFVFPAGLVLYWLTNNLLSILQQWFINKQLGVLGK
jgi:YidC/Oxa1 family membrane protein insertase